MTNNFLEKVLVSILTLAMIFPCSLTNSAKAEDIEPGVKYDNKYVKMDGHSSIYLIKDKGRWLIPKHPLDTDNGSQYFNAIVNSHGVNLSDVLTISQVEIESMPLKGNIKVKPGAKYLLGLITNENRYISIDTGVLKKVSVSDFPEHEEIIVPDAFFVNYRIEQEPYICNNSECIWTDSLIMVSGHDGFLYYLDNEEIKRVIPYLADDEGSQYRDAVLSSNNLDKGQYTIIVYYHRISSYPQGSNMTIKANSNYLLKMQNDNKYYIVTESNFLKEVKKDDYTSYIEVMVPDSLFVNYVIKEVLPEEIETPPVVTTTSGGGGSSGGGGGGGGGGGSAKTTTKEKEDETKETEEKEEVSEKSEEKKETEEKEEEKEDEQASKEAIEQEKKETEKYIKEIKSTNKKILKINRKITKIEKEVIVLEMKLTKADNNFSKKYAGTMFLDVENHGRLWYVEPESKNRFYFENGEGALSIGSKLATGISYEDIKKIPIGVSDKLYNLKDSDQDGLSDRLEDAIGSDKNNKDTDGDGINDKDEILEANNPNDDTKYNYDEKLIKRLEGKMLLQVAGPNSHGEIWYIQDGKRWYGGTEDSMYEIMKSRSLGAKAEDIRKIEVGAVEE